MEVVAYQAEQLSMMLGMIAGILLVILAVELINRR